jgi:NhaA family Na+:H+ antiporter
MNRSTLLSNLATGVLVACAVAVTTAVLRREFLAAAPPPAAAEPRRIDDWEPLAREGARMGSAGAPVSIVEFSDFQCPFCRTVQGPLAAARARHGDRVAIVFRHLPLDAIHPHARAAANAAECAGDQGRFEAYHDLLFARQDSIGITPWARFAADAGVPDLPQFEACVAEERHADRVERDARLATALGLEATPTLIVNGTVYSGAPDEAELERLIAAAR